MPGPVSCVFVNDDSVIRKLISQNGGLQIWNWMTAILGASLVEKVGRRPLWLATFGGMLAANIPFGACSA